MLVILLVIVVRVLGGLQRWEWMALDQGLRLRPAETLDERIVIVGITDADIQRLQAYPVPDQALAKLLRKIQDYQPQVIGLDLFRDFPIPPGEKDLEAAITDIPNLVGIEKVLSSEDSIPIPALDVWQEDQIGFADVIPDEDGGLRRVLLGTSTAGEEYRFSFSIRVAETYLKHHHRTLKNGVKDPLAMRLGQTELTRFRSHTGGYVRADDGGNQILLNYRQNPRPFRTFLWADFNSGQVKPEELYNRIVLVGMTSISQKDLVQTAAVNHPSTGLPGQIYGVEAQAHAISQLINAELEGRPLLTGWSEVLEYLWIVIWGVLGVLIKRWSRYPMIHILMVVVASAGLFGLAYVSLLSGVWIPLVPPLLVFGINGVVLYIFWLYDQGLRSQLQDRQQVIDSAFDAIHNGPLQTLAGVLRGVHDRNTSTSELEPQLQHLNQELRGIYNLIRQETLRPEPILGLSSDLQLGLTAPLHELLCTVYWETLNRDLPGFADIKFKIVKFEPMDERALSLELKRRLCRFLEEVLCNIGKHANGVTQVSVTCMQDQGYNRIEVADNGTKSNLISATKMGWGTQQAEHLARQLGGTFQQHCNTPPGHRYKLKWSVKRQPFWRFFLVRRFHQ
ncbi:CHASE2 domain-containing protein [Acaryochloris sp. IP29b_bin.137]|uniref:CHASE2 domain-containing protein n=1 Tax=Acaryochloris sp. IP29b_bin.137 TaxID=2969217 RepID=UPI00262C78D0|nr:CHASE2 domain-containing protein [Acaryochloris sp. IP29b_bin.137]